MSPASPSQAPALVIGLAIHGLALVRALASRGVEVHAFAHKERRPGPTTYTRHARVHERDALNSPALVEHLVEFARHRRTGGRIVLFPTSDRMVEAIATGWGSLEPHYLLSWAHCRELVLRLQSKAGLAEFARRAGIDYPRSAVIETAGDCARIAADLRLPAIVKPARPLSSFKALIVEDTAGLQALVHRYSRDLPFVIQEYIAGDDGTLHACTAYLDRGRELCSFTSLKLASSPPGLGQGTVFVTEDNPATRDLARRFLAGLDLSGPVAVEFKRDPQGRYWLIEPNVGRTEYCVDLAIQSGLNLPWIEYCHVLGREVPAQVNGAVRPSAWFDTDKDPLCWLRLSRHQRARIPPGTSTVFPYAGHRDLKPLLVSSVQQLTGTLRSGAGWLLRR